MKKAKYFYHYTVYKTLSDKQIVVGQGSGVTDFDLTIMNENDEEECPFSLLTAQLRKACKISSADLFLDIDVITKL